MLPQDDFLTVPQAGGSDQDTGGARGASAPELFRHLTDRELFERLGWFISIRWLAGIIALFLVLLGWYQFDVRIPPRPVVLTICVLFLYNAVFLMVVTDAYRRRKVSRRFISGCANGQIICDLVTLAVLMHFTGGVENYFMVFFICPMIIASELLSSRNAYAHAAFGSLLIQAVAWLEFAGVIPHVQVGRAIGFEVYSSPVAVMKLTVALNLLLFAVVFLGSSIACRLRRREEALEEAYAQLHRLEESKSYFMRKTSHELRAPLNAVIAMLEATRAQTSAGDASRVESFVDRALRRTRSLSTLIQDLHRYALLRDERAVRVKTSLDLAQIVERCVEGFMPMAQSQGLRLSCALDPVEMQGDAESLAAMVDNLIVNSIQYTPAGGDIEVRLNQRKATATLVVRDTGIGIGEVDRRRVFEEFYRAGEAQRVCRHGTGLGLPIVRRIVETHAGTIRVESEPGVGTTFIVEFPAKWGAAQKKTRDSLAKAERGSSSLQSV